MKDDTSSLGGCAGTSRGLIALFWETTLPEWSIVRLRIESERRRLDQLPHLAPALIAQRLLVSGEDHRHAGHPGFDLIGIGRACWRRITRYSCEGASTIEQQVVRVLTGRYERTLSRKAKEILLAILVARTFPKKLLPPVYLAIGYYGWHMNGYVQACRRLGYAPDRLTIVQAACLVARLKYPEGMNPTTQRTRQIEQRSAHLRRLYDRHVRGTAYRHLDVTSVRCGTGSSDTVPTFQ